MIKFFTLMMFVFFSCVLYSNSLEITFQQKSDIVIGTAPVLTNTEQVRNSAREQASVYYAKLTGVHSLYKKALLHVDDNVRSSDESASFEVNIVKSLNNIYDSYDNLFFIDNITKYSYFIAFYSKNSFTPLPLIRHFTVIQPDEETQETLEQEKSEVKTIEVFSNQIISYGNATSARLDVALDNAFDKALIEMSRFLDTEVKNMTRTSNEFLERTTLISSNSTLNSIYFNKITINHFEKDNRFYFVANVSLRKNIK